MVAHGPKKGKKAGPYMLGSALSGVLEMGIFHPVDTCAKRLMSNTMPIVDGGVGSVATVSNLKQVVFAKAVNEGFIGKYKNMYPGIGFGTFYKILQRTYKFGSQPLLKGTLDRHHGDAFRSTFGKKTGQDLMHSFAGSLVGLGEVVLLPLDLLKIKAQTNPAALSGRGMFDIFRTEGFALYRGWNWTAMRNMPGSFALFGATSLVYTRVFDIDKDSKKTVWQTFCGSFAGGVASIAISSPMDVVKTRIQNKAFDDKRTGRQILSALFRDEGAGALFKGLTPKIGLIGPKLVFSWTVAQLISHKLAENWPQ